MSDADSEVKKIKTQIIPAIHNTVSLQVYLKTEEGEPIPGQTIIYKFSIPGEGEYSRYERTTNEDGRASFSLFLTKDTEIDVLYEGNEEYVQTSLSAIRVEPTQEEIDRKNNHPNVIRMRDLLQKKREIRRAELDEMYQKMEDEEKLQVVEDYEKSQMELQTIGEDNTAIELKNVSLSFKIGNDKIDNLKEYVIRTLNRTKEKKTIFKATDDVSFKIYKGEKVGIIGFNGAGKSTLLKIISGVYAPDEGEVIINGNIAPLLSLGAGFDKNYSGRENVFLNGSILGYNEEFLKEKYDEIIEFAELGEFIDLPVKNYSSGMLSKLGFSIATIVEPDILILDEVLGVGDITFRRKSRRKLKSLMESNTTVLLVSHSINEIRSICDKAIWIDKGKVREVGEVNFVCDQYEEEAKNVSREKTKKLKPKRF